MNAPPSSHQHITAKSVSTSYEATPEDPLVISHHVAAHASIHVLESIIIRGVPIFPGGWILVELKEGVRVARISSLSYVEPYEYYIALDVVWNEKSLTHDGESGLMAIPIDSAAPGTTMHVQLDMLQVQFTALWALSQFTTSQNMMFFVKKH